MLSCYLVSVVANKLVFAVRYHPHARAASPILHHNPPLAYIVRCALGQSFSRLCLPGICVHHVGGRVFGD